MLLATLGMLWCAILVFLFSNIFQWSADHLSVYSDSVVFQLYARSQREISSHAFKKSYPINWLLFLDIDIFVLAILLQFQVCNDDFFCSPQYFISVPYVCLVNFLRSICVFFYAENTSNFCVLIKKKPIKRYEKKLSIRQNFQNQSGEIKPSNIFVYCVCACDSHCVSFRICHSYLQLKSLRAT